MRHLPNFVPIGQSVSDVAIFFIFQDGGGPPYWICCRHIATTHEDYLVVCITVQNVVGIDAVVLNMWTF